MNAAPAGHPSPEEVDAMLDDATGSTGERVGAHVAGCERCQSLAEGMREVRAALRAQAASPPVMPPEVQARLEAALSDAAAARAGSGSGSRTIVPLDRDGAAGRSRGSRYQEGAGRGAGVPRWLTVAAGLAVLGGAATASTQLFGSGGQDEASTAGGAVQDSAADGGAAESAEGFPGVTTSGTAYRPDALPEQVQALLAGEEAADGGGQPGALSAAQTPLRDPDTLGRCLEALGAAGQVPLAVDAGTWQGQDASVVVLPDDARPGTVQVWVVGPACGDPDDDLLHYQAVQQ